MSPLSQRARDISFSLWEKAEKRKLTGCHKLG